VHAVNDVEQQRDFEAAALVASAARTWAIRVVSAGEIG